MSLDADGQPMDLIYEGEEDVDPIEIKPHTF